MARDIGLAAVVAAIWSCGSADRTGPPAAEFRDPRRVEIQGNPGSAMEPFISCDGRSLFFNNRNEPAALTDILVAERVADDVFRLLGPVPGLNAPPPALDGVPSMDAGNLFFVSTRSYETSLCTLHSGAWQAGSVTGVRLVAGDFCRRQAGWLTMDAEISRDGAVLYFVDARFAGGTVPEEADIGVARRGSNGAFQVAPNSRELLRSVNTSALEYAPATSADGLELFFTRFDGSLPMILRATRAQPADPFGPPQRLAVADGFVEAPSLSCDGRSLYYHKKDGPEFSVFRVVRPD